ncbi:hypothetical protein [Paenibacillus segetis]|nr:hypothetical protein [Paenibacillus segetis]
MPRTNPSASPKGDSDAGALLSLQRYLRRVSKGQQALGALP